MSPNQMMEAVYTFIIFFESKKYTQVRLAGKRGAGVPGCGVPGYEVPGPVENVGSAGKRGVW